MTTAAFATFLSLALIAPFIAWGFYLLRMQFSGEREIPVTIEAVTLALLVVFYAFQFALLEALLSDSLGQFVGASLLLIATGAALYGPMLTSLISRVMVGMFMPDSDAPIRTPHFGAGERHERLDDFEGALLEYESVARLFPNHPDVLLRLGSTLARLGRYEEAAEQLTLGVEANPDPEESYPLVARLVEILDHNLGKREDAIGVLTKFASRFEGSTEAERAQRRIERLTKTRSALATARPAAISEETMDTDGAPGAPLPGMALPSAESASNDEDDDDTGLPGAALPPPRGL